MKFTMTKIAALAAMAFASTGAHAALDTSGILALSIENDAITSFNATSSSFYVSSDGPMLDSFFTMSGSKTKQALDTQYAYINGTSNVINLNNSVEGTLGTFIYYGAPGSNDTGSFGGISVLSASGDTAKLNMSNWKVDWNSVLDIHMGTGAWSVGYTSGVGNLTCTAGSGCAVGSAYTLKYTATVPVGDPSGFGGVKYYLELHGCVAWDCSFFEETSGINPNWEPGFVATIPEASTYTMMLAGLGLVGFMARHRKQSEA